MWLSPKLNLSIVSSASTGEYIANEKTESEKYGANYKLEIVKDNLLPKYLISNKEKYKDWFDNLDD